MDDSGGSSGQVLKLENVRSFALLLTTMTCVPLVVMLRDQNVHAQPTAVNVLCGMTWFGTDTSRVL